MTKLTIYSTLGYQVEPDPGGKKEAKGAVRGLIDGSVEFFADSDSKTVVGYVRANSSVSGGRQYDHFFAEFKADQFDNILDEFVEELQKLESGASNPDADWEFREDKERFNLPWLFESARGSALTDLGLSIGEQLAVEQLLEEGERLEVGVNGWESAAIAVRHLLEHTSNDVSIAVSSDGRKPSIDSTTLVIEPEHEKNFTPLSEATASKMVDRRDGIKEDIKNWFQSEIKTQLDILVNSSERAAWETWAEISQISNKVRRPASNIETTDLETKPGTRILELVQALKNGVVVDQRYDPKVLSDESTQTLLDWIRNQVQEAVQEFQTKAYDYCEAEFDTLIESVNEQDAESAHRSFTQMRQILEGNTSRKDTDYSDEVQKFAEYYNQVLDTDLLNQTQTRKLVDSLQNRIDDLIDEYITTERDRVRERFDTAIEELRDRSYETVAEQIQVATAVLEDPSSRDVNRSKAPLKFRRAVSTLEKSEILSGQEKKALRANILQELNEARSELEDEYKEEQKRQLQSSIESAQNRTNNLDEEFKLLCLVKRRLASHEIEAGEFTEFSRINSQIAKIEDDSLLSGADITSIRSETKRAVDGWIEDVREEKAASLLDTLENELSAFLRSTDERAKSLTQLRDLRRYCDNRISQQELPDNTWINRIQSQIDTVTDTEFRGIPLFDRQRQQNILDDFKDSVKSEIEGLKTEEKNQLTSDFNETLERIVNNDRFSARNKIVVLRYILSELDEKGHHESPTEARRRKLTETAAPDLDKYSTDLKEVLKTVLHNESDVLTRTGHREVKEQFRDRAVEDLDTLQRDLAADVSNRIQTAIRSLSDEGRTSDAADIKTITAAIDQLNQLISDLETRSHSQFRKLDLPEETLEGFDLLDPEYQQQVTEEAVDSAEEQLTSLQDKRSKQVADLFQSEIEQIETSVNSPRDKIAEYTEIRRVMNNQRNRSSNTLSDTDRLRSYRTHLTDEDRERIESRIQENRRTAVQTLKESVVQDVESALTAYDETDAHTATGVNSFLEFLDGEDFDPRWDSIQQAVDRVQQIREFSELHSRERDEILNGIRSVAEDYYEDADGPEPGRGFSVPVLGSSSLGRRSVFLVVAVVVTALAIVAIWQLGALSQSGGGGADTLEIAELTVDEDGDVLSVQGRVASATESIMLRVDGSNVSVEREIDVDEGQFESRLSPGESGSYVVALRASGESANWLNFSLTPTQNNSSSMVEVTDPVAGETTGATIPINATTNASSYSVTVYNRTGSVVRQTTGIVSNGSIRTPISVNSSGRYYVQITGTNPRTRTVVRAVRVEIEL